MADYSWLKYAPGTAFEMLVGKRKTEDDDEDEKKKKRARKVQTSLAGSSAPAQYRMAMNKNIDWTMKQ